jgi:hypothetical protein
MKTAAYLTYWHRCAARTTLIGGPILSPQTDGTVRSAKPHGLTTGGIGGGSVLRRDENQSAVNRTPRSASSAINWSSRAFSFVLLDKSQTAISDSAGVAHASFKVRWRSSPS